MKKIKQIISQTRRRGNTTWILQSAIVNPDCIVVSFSHRHSSVMERSYYELISKQPWYKKLCWKLFGRKNPMFLTLSDDFEMYKLPVIFDNHVLDLIK